NSRNYNLKNKRKQCQLNTAFIKGAFLFGKKYYFLRERRLGFCVSGIRCQVSGIRNAAANAVCRVVRRSYL
ncbi:MAG: hypothetical protein LBG61_01830, partial [Burkholderiales bacterium]|nr:hypothetical protein [Burkholderiales bacterium]